MRDKTSNWRRWLDDPGVKLWHDAMEIKSPVTADERVRVLGRYCDAVGTTPAKLVERSSTPSGVKGVADELQALTIRMAREGHAPQYIANFVKSVRAWLRHNDIGMVRKISIGDAGARPTVENERLPTRSEVHDVLIAGNPRAKVIVSLCAFAGVRTEVVGYYRAKDGLRLSDLPELRVKDGRVRVLHEPMRVNVRRSLSKIKTRYHTYLTAEGCAYLRTYLEERIALGEVLGPDSPVVRPDYGRESKGRPEDMRGSPFLGRQGVSREIRNLFRARDLSMRPYVLRSFWESAMAIAEREGKITQLDREFWAGRKGAIDARYTVHKELAPDVVEAMREAYSRADPYLATATPALAPDSDVRLELAELRAENNAQAARLEEIRSLLDAFTREQKDALGRFLKHPGNEMHRTG